jgi:hypothetical protein
MKNIEPTRVWVHPQEQLDPKEFHYECLDTVDDHYLVRIQPRAELGKIMRDKKQGNL